MNLLIILFHFSLLFPQEKGLECRQCSDKLALEIANKKIVKNGLNLDKLDFKIKTLEMYYEIVYTTKSDLSIRGGGGVIRIDKNNCKVVGKLFYQ